MDAVQKARTARILGIICVLVGALNLFITAVETIQAQAPVGLPLSVTGVIALGGGIFLLTLARRKPPSEG